jgi:hypothetical protein
MNCSSARSNWELYHDSEGDAPLYREINEHLERCGSCRTWFDEQQTFEDGLRTRLNDAAPSSELWASIERPLEDGDPAAKRWAPWLRYVGVAACLMGLLAAWWFFDEASVAKSDLARLVSAQHERLIGDNQLDFASESDLAVEAYLKSRVSFPVRCPPRQNAGFAVRGGGVLTIRDTPAAYVHGLVETERVSVFIFPRDQLAQFGLEQDLFKNSNVIHQRVGSVEVVLSAIDQNLVVVVGRQSLERLERVVRAYGTYPEAHSHDAA